MLSDQPGASLARDFPFFPFLAERGVEFAAQRFELRLKLIPNHVDLGVIGDRPESDSAARARK